MKQFHVQTAGKCKTTINQLRGILCFTPLEIFLENTPTENTDREKLLGPLTRAKPRALREKQRKDVSSPSTNTGLGICLRERAKERVRQQTWNNRGYL